MKRVLVTGPTGFLGYHVIKLLNERGIQPRVLVEDGNRPPPSQKDLKSEEFKKAMKEWKALEATKKLKVEIMEGNVNDLASLSTACDGIDTLFHLKFGIALGDGDEVEKILYKENVEGTRNVLDAATEKSVKKVVVSSSALAVGLNFEPEPLNETADWDTYKYSLPYAMSRRQAEDEALARPNGETLPIISAVNPSFTLGPEDFVGAPANKLANLMIKRWFRFAAPIGFGVLDVRDYADGALRTAEHGRHGQRYILSGHNIDSKQLLKTVAEVNGFKPPQWFIPIPGWFVSFLIKGSGLLKGKLNMESPSALELWGRYAWYDTTLARQELDWEPRSLTKTIEDTLSWMRENAS